MSHAHFLLNQTCGNNLISDHSSVLAQTAGQTVPNLSLLLADYPPKRYTSWKYLLVLFPYNASGTSYSCSSLQSKRKGTSHISMTHALLCIYSFLILFQKVFHCENLWCFDIQHQKVFIPGQKYINPFHNCSCKDRGIFYIPHFRELVQIQFFRCINQFKWSFHEKSVKEFSLCRKFTFRYKS